VEAGKQMAANAAPPIKLSQEKNLNRKAVK